MEDKNIKCRDCSGAFVWTAKDQEFYLTKGYDAPRRCKSCRQVKKDAKAAQEAAGKQGSGSVRESGE